MCSIGDILELRDIGPNYCDARKGYYCAETGKFPTRWTAQTLTIIFKGWNCEFITNESEFGIKEFEANSKVECTPPRIEFRYLPAKFSKKYVKKWKFQSPNCQKVLCKNPVWDHPYGSFPLGQLELSRLLSPYSSSKTSASKGSSTLDKIGPYYLSGDECNEPGILWSSFLKGG
eukprot:CAMPEP_0196599524 /NCGR_PEP_ID=MMETSP1081-20130531/94904_1 /TAXON_ID=36882 /ORGANISM="Pyramimonas amylifera, Strain CCMP720" /LENGTH=173 /DNA_ID=CAMNT_0041925303 /DNA_START=947 /DNA_END=1464 /DNA_ORIENTATION=-